MGSLLRPLKNRESSENGLDPLSVLSHLAQIPINTTLDLEKFFGEVVDETSRVVEAEKISLNFLKNDLDDPDNSHNRHCTVYVPITIHESNLSLGYLKVKKNENQEIDSREIKFLEAIAHLTGLKFQNSTFQLVIYQGLVQTLKVLVNVVEAKDVYTRCHSQRVTEYSLEIAKLLGLPQEEQDTLKIASILHDIGKIAIAESILLKRGRLTPDEFEIIKLHPIFGDEILKPLKFFHQERKLILYHHERWDGSGYPEGLFGENIPLLSRIIAVADSFDAMTSDRIYRKAKSFEEALDEIKGLSGIKYDPKVVNAFYIILKKAAARSNHSMQQPPIPEVI